MAASKKALEDLALSLAREIPHLRPSQQRRLSEILETPEQIAVFGRALTLALRAISALNAEAVERVFLMGLEVSQILDQRRGAKPVVQIDWSEIEPTVRHAFLSGIDRCSLAEALLPLANNTRIGEPTKVDQRPQIEDVTVERSPLFTI